LEEERKIEQLQTIEQGGRTCNEYVQEFKKVARGSGYEGRPLIEEFKRGLNRAIRRKLAEAKEPPTTIGECVRATRAEHSRRFLSLDYVIKYVTTHLQEIPQRIR